MNKQDNPKYLKSFGRIMSRSLKEEQQRVYDKYQDTICIEPDNIANHLGNYKKINFEIGFGSGEHVHELAALFPQELFIGCETYLNGVVQLLKAVDNQGLKNVRFNNHDARVLLEAMPNESVDNLYILFADPWSKTRHNKRRIVNEYILNIAAQKIKENGALIIATDHSDYAIWIYNCINENKTWQKLDKVLEGYKLKPKGWVATRYEGKALERGDDIYYFIMNKNK